MWKTEKVQVTAELFRIGRHKFPAEKLWKIGENFPETAFLFAAKPLKQALLAKRTWEEAAVEKFALCQMVEKPDFFHKNGEKRGIFRNVTAVFLIRLKMGYQPKFFLVSPELFEISPQGKFCFWTAFDRVFHRCWKLCGKLEDDMGKRVEKGSELMLK